MQHDASLPDPTPSRQSRRRPQLGRNVVLRQRLHTRLDRALTVPLTLIAAPAGFGKTTLLLAWAIEQTIPTIWLTVDQDARALGQFVTQLTSAMADLLPELQPVLAETLRQARDRPARQAGLILADALDAVPFDLVVIIDDYYQAASTEVEGFLGGLLHQPPPLLHLALATRVDPALPLARMRLHDELLEFRAADLRFTAEETRALLTVTGTADDPALVARLQERSEGWIAGLKLATLALPAVDGGDRAAQVGDDQQHMMDFLVEEVLANLSPQAQAFLLRTAIVDTVSAPLADAILDDAPAEGSLALLRRLVRDGLGMAEIRDDGEWFRYHPLFRNLLRHHLEVRVSPAERSALHRRAAAWFAQEGLLEEALQHCLADDVATAAQFVADHAHGALNREEWLRVSHWLHRLPESVIRSDPRLLVVQACVSHISGRLVSVRMQAGEIKALLPSSGLDEAACAIISAECDALSLSHMSELAVDPQATVALAEQTLPRIPADHCYMRGLAYLGYGAALRSAGRADEAIRWLTATVEAEAEQFDAGTIRALFCLVVLYRQAGNFRACTEIGEKTLRLAERHNFPLIAGWMHLALGWMAFERNDLDVAKAHFTTFADNVQVMHLSAASESFFGLARVYQAQGLRVEADATLRRFLEIILDAHSLDFLPTIRAFEAHLALLRQEPSEAIAWVRSDQSVSLFSNVLSAFEHDFLIRIKALLAEGSAESLTTAWDDLVAMRSLASAQHQQGQDVEIHALAALILAAQGAEPAALSELRSALALGAADARFRTFVDLGPDIVPLLQRLHSNEPSPYIASLLAAFHEKDQDAVHPSTALPYGKREGELEVLTLRESEVLHALARRLSYQEIGDELFISAHTVKSHATHIYEKLGVANRRQALAKAQALGWVS